MYIHRCSAGESREGDSRDSGLASARAFFEGLLDYAGLFPPASLAITDALAHYAAYRAQPYGWIMSRFVLGAAHLPTLGDLSPYGFSRDSPLEIALVSREAMADIARIVASPLLRDGCGELSSIEVTLDPNRSISGQCREVYQLVIALRRLLAVAESPTLFFELPHGEMWDTVLVELLDVVQALQAESADDGERRIIGVKLRCGGASPNATPPPSLVATVLARCGTFGIPIKCTAGLHHPFRHTVASAHGEAEAVAHGYFNILFAALVAQRAQADEAIARRSVSEEELCALVSEECSVQPQFTDQGLEWKGYLLSTETISRLRATQVISFGTCSFVEPLEEAIKRGWL